MADLSALEIAISLAIAVALGLGVMALYFRKPLDQATYEPDSQDEDDIQSVRRLLTDDGDDIGR
jgi:hypothetical protein